MNTRIPLALWLVAVGGSCAAAQDWFYFPSTFSHDPATGRRVTQFAPADPAIVAHQQPLVRSGFRQQQSVIRAGGSLDSYNAVDRYGETVRPYGEWLYPYRPYSVPYDAWGPPYGGANGQYSGQQRYNGPPPIYGPGAFGFPLGAAVPPAAPPAVPPDGAAPAAPGTVRAFSQERSRINGLFDGQGIPGDDGHYLDQQRRLEQLNDRRFYYRIPD